MKTTDCTSSAQNNYSLADLARLASDLVDLHFNVHPLLVDQPLAFRECLVQELKAWYFVDDIETMLARIVPGLDRQAFRVIATQAMDLDI